MGEYPSNNKDKPEKKGKRNLEKGLLSIRTEGPKLQGTRKGKGGKILQT
jgi:hypothetical protein